MDLTGSMDGGRWYKGVHVVVAGTLVAVAVRSARDGTISVLIGYYPRRAPYRRSG